MSGNILGISSTVLANTGNAFRYGGTFWYLNTSDSYDTVILFAVGSYVKLRV